MKRIKETRKVSSDDRKGTPWSMVGFVSLIFYEKMPTQGHWLRLSDRTNVV